MRLVFLIVVVLAALIQYPLWLGKGGWFNAWELQGALAEQKTVNEGLRARNAALDAEVQDLQTGTGALEERARGDLGMMREGEVYVQILPQHTAPPAGAHTSIGAAAAGEAPPGTDPTKPPVQNGASGRVPGAQPRANPARPASGASAPASGGATTTPSRTAPAGATTTPSRAAPAGANTTGSRPAQPAGTERRQ
ncbi:cell division protein FtsB [Schauerella aestuarii]|uniref:cell division protein FtsB n=1 Tax=Schauerella aestuarii TaxID=2511204 RepID=UPI00136EFF18|nr:cell division protein FtsB [Achromobacter aestuarii]